MCGIGELDVGADACSGDVCVRKCVRERERERESVDVWEVSGDVRQGDEGERERERERERIFWGLGFCWRCLWWRYVCMRERVRNMCVCVRDTEIWVCGLLQESWQLVLLICHTYEFRHVAQIN